VGAEGLEPPTFAL